MNCNITKSSIAQSIFYETGLPITILEKFLDSFFEQIIKNTIADNVTKIPKFGSFYVKNKTPRIGRNLNTNESVIISSRKVISFKPSDHLKHSINMKPQKSRVNNVEI